jgi:hypothetical protein
LVAIKPYFKQIKKAMKAATERKIIRWIHIIGSVPIIGLIYGPVKNIPQAVSAIQWVIFPLIVLTGFWLWLGHGVRKWIKRTSRQAYALTKKG